MRSAQSKKIDYIFALIVIFLVLFGIVMIYSVSSVISQEKFGNPYYYVSRQIISFVIGLIVLFITYLIDYRMWKNYLNVAEKKAKWQVYEEIKFRFDLFKVFNPPVVSGILFSLCEFNG